MTGIFTYIYPENYPVLWVNSPVPLSIWDTHSFTRIVEAFRGGSPSGSGTSWSNGQILSQAGMTGSCFGSLQGNFRSIKIMGNMETFIYSLVKVNDLCFFAR